MFTVQSKAPGRKWKDVDTLPKDEAFALARDLRATQEGVSDWDAIQYRVGMARH